MKAIGLLWWAVACVAAVPASAGAAVIEADGDVLLSAGQVEWTLDGPFALRRVELVLRNPHDRPLETTVSLPLASNERLHGYALDVEGRLRDAVPVERVKARAAFEDTVRREVDPALAEKQAGNRYSIRVFPVPAHGERRLRIDIASLAGREGCGWKHVLDPAVPPSRAASLLATATAPPVAGQGGGLPWTRGGHGVQARWQGASAPPRQVCLPAPAGDAAFSAAFDDGLRMHWLEVPARAPATRQERALPAHVEVVWDASLSMQDVDRRAELALLSRYLEGRPVEVTVSVLREGVQRRRARVATPAQLDALLASLAGERADGATALSAWQADPSAGEVLMFSDAVATLPGEVATAGVPVFVIGRAIGDPAMARWLSRSGGQVLDLAMLSPEQALGRLRHAPVLQARLGPLDAGWHADQLSVGGGVLRACHVSDASSAVPGLPLEHAQADGGAVVRRHRPVPLRASDLAAFWCASWQAEDLEAQPGRHRAALAALGERFGVANRQTSLLVLESDEEYVRHGILPPRADAGLHGRVLAQRHREDERRAAAWAANREAVRAGWQARSTWWNTVFPKEDPRPRWERERREAEREAQRAAARVARERREAGEPAMAMAPPPAPAPASAELDSVAVTGARATDAPVELDAAPAIAMHLQAVSMDAPWVAGLREARDAAALYARYFDLRVEHGRSPAFHFDVAQRLFELGDTALGWRVLSNLVELMPEDPASLRLAAYRLQDAGLASQALPLLRRIRELAPEQPQSFRDLALALQAPDTCQEALGLLGHVVDTPWPGRFADIGLVALAEHNDLRTRCPGGNGGGMAAEFPQPLPVGLRVTLRWDLDDTDIDLHVTDPNGETVYYSHPLSYQGGRISRDFTAGFGPEEFVLRDPKPGAYKVEVNYYGSRLARLSRGAGINVALQTGFGTAGMRQQSISLRLLEQSGKVAVGGFTVGRDGGLVVGGSGPAAASK
ncbi:VIT domain-containing protein [Pseudoxanthomonas sp. 10H]|uniref:VIT domain-containing protein n=1 Tax=Pseudoxanthomonas sp. 10H TaxID=3242729 RepID=UPI0035587859